MDIQGTLNQIVVFVQQYWYVIVIAAGLIFLVVYLAKRKPQIKPLDRAKIEHKKVIERQKFNYSKYKWLSRGEIILGKIVTLKYANILIDEVLKEKVGVLEAELERCRLELLEIDDYDKIMGKLKEIKNIQGKIRNLTDPLIQVIINAPLFSKYKIENPWFWKEKHILYIKYKNTVFDWENGEIEVNENTTFDKFMGIYYDDEMEKDTVSYILHNTVFRTDMENLGTEYFVESQKKSVIDLQQAHEMAMKEKELQIELAKKRGKQTSI